MPQTGPIRAPFEAGKLIGCTAILAVMLAGTPGYARMPETATPVATASADPSAFVGPGALNTRLENTDFMAPRAELEASFSAAEPDKRPSLALDYAQFLIGWMMLPEARSFVEFATQHMDADSPRAIRAEAYGSIIEILTVQEGTLSRDNLSQPVLSDPVWGVIADIQSGETISATRLHDAAAKLDRHSRFVSGRLAPYLFEAALAAGEAEFARSLLNTAVAGTDLEGTSEMLLMRGRLARVEGQDQTAFDFFAWASEGQDRAGVEARLELADMALEEPDRLVRERVRDLLVEGLPRWRGDDLALAMRARLALVSEDLGDAETAIITMSLIEEDHPGTPEAELARERIGLILNHLADAIDADAMGLTEALSITRRIEPYMGRHLERAVVRGALARKLEKSGLTVAASAEYRDIWDGLLAPEREGLPPALLDRIVLEEARWLILSDQPNGARDMTQHRPAQRDTGLDSEFAKIELAAGGQPVRDPDADPKVALEIARDALKRGHETHALEAFNAAGQLPSAEGISATRIAAEGGPK